MYKSQLLPAEMAEDSNEHDEKWHSFLSSYQEQSSIPLPMLCIRQMLFIKVTFPGSLFLPSKVDPVSMCSPFPTRCLEFTGVKNRYISPGAAWDSLYLYGGTEKHTYCAAGTEKKKKTMTFKIQWQISYSLCKGKSTRRNKGPNKKVFCWDLEMCCVVLCSSLISLSGL